MNEQEARDEREALADVLMSDGVRITAAMGRDYALVEADAVLAWMRDQGYRKHPEPEWEYGIARLPSGYGFVAEMGEESARASVRREPGEWVLMHRAKAIQAGLWEPVA